MFIELAEYLRCPADATESHCVVTADRMIDRRIIAGTIGCPATKREYPIVGGVADFRSADPSAAFPEAPPDVTLDAATVHALLGLTTPGGYIVLLGSAAVGAADLAARFDGVHVVAVNPPSAVAPARRVSVLHGPVPVPLRTSMARGVVVGREYAEEPWLSECSRILLKGLRVVVLDEEVAVPHTCQMGSGNGMWVGRRE
jgi:uncharacterized protein YbaR (Trm112 family)